MTRKKTGSGIAGEISIACRAKGGEQRAPYVGLDVTFLPLR